jgi:hypothetical protein
VRGRRSGHFVCLIAKNDKRNACPTIQNYGRSMMVTRPSATGVPLAEIAH